MHDNTQKEISFEIMNLILQNIKIYNLRWNCSVIFDRFRVINFEDKGAVLYTFRVTKEKEEEEQEWETVHSSSIHSIHLLLISLLSFSGSLWHQYIFERLLMNSDLTVWSHSVSTIGRRSTIYHNWYVSPLLSLLPSFISLPLLFCLPSYPCPLASPFLTPPISFVSVI